MMGWWSCQGKVRYGTRAAADRAARAIDGRRYHARPDVYRCRCCTGWHLGHPRPRPRQAPRRRRLRVPGDRILVFRQRVVPPAPGPPAPVVAWQPPRSGATIYEHLAARGEALPLLRAFGVALAAEPAALGA